MHFQREREDFQDPPVRKQRYPNVFGYQLNEVVIFKFFFSSNISAEVSTIFLCDKLILMYIVDAIRQNPLPRKKNLLVWGGM